MLFKGNIVPKKNFLPLQSIKKFPLPSKKISFSLTIYKKLSKFFFKYCYRKCAKKLDEFCVLLQFEQKYELS